MATECECCMWDTDGLFPITANKVWQGEDYTEIADWCGPCYENGSCKTPYGGVCYRHETDEAYRQWLEENDLW